MSVLGLIDGLVGVGRKHLVWGQNTNQRDGVFSSRGHPLAQEEDHAVVYLSISRMAVSADCVP